MGGHPTWKSLRGLSQIEERPLFLGGVYFLSGF
jgi:hypothetical protein